MAGGVKCDCRQLKRLRDNLTKLQDADMEKFCTDMSKELAAKLLALVIHATPVGDYSREVTVVAKRTGKKHFKGEVYTKKVNTSGKKGGTLRRGWTARTQAEAESGSGNGAKAAEFAATMAVKRVGTTYTIEIINPVEYASYVEFGHRTPKGGWVVGQYFLTNSENEIKRRAPAWIEARLKRLLQEAFNV